MKTNVFEPREDTVKVFILFVRIVVLAKQIDTRCSAITAWSIAAHAEMRLRRVLVHPNNPNTPNTSNNYEDPNTYACNPDNNNHNNPENNNNPNGPNNPNGLKNPNTPNTPNNPINPNVPNDPNFPDNIYLHLSQLIIVFSEL